MVEQRPQTVSACQRRVGIVVSCLMERDTRRGHVRDRARRVVAEARLVDEAWAARARAPASPQAPSSAARSASCAVPGRRRRRRPGPAPSRRRPRGRPSHDRSRRAALAPPRERGARPGSSRFPARADPAPDRRRRAPARHRRASCAPAESRPRARSWRCHRRAGSLEVAPSARASHRSASAGRPVNARTQAPKTAIAGYRSARHR